MNVDNPLSFYLQPTANTAEHKFTGTMPLPSLLLPSDGVGSVAEFCHTGGCDQPSLNDLLQKMGPPGKRTTNPGGGDDSKPISQTEPPAISDDQKGKKRKLHDAESEDGSKMPYIGIRVRDRGDYDKLCGVFTESNLPCLNSIHNCLDHSRDAKHSVQGLAKFSCEPILDRSPGLTADHSLPKGHTEKEAGREQERSKWKKRKEMDEEDTHSSVESNKSLFDPMYDRSFYDPTLYGRPLYGGVNGTKRSPAQPSTASHFGEQNIIPSFDEGFGLAVATVPRQQGPSLPPLRHFPSSSSSIYLPRLSAQNGNSGPQIFPRDDSNGSIYLPRLSIEHRATYDVPKSRRERDSFNPSLSYTLQLEHHDEPPEVTRQVMSVDLDAGPFLHSARAESVGNWEVWWREMAAVLRMYPNFDVGTKMDCVRLARSAKIYQKLVVYVYMQVKVRYTTPEFIGSLRETLSKWEAWNDLQWIANHHIVRMTLWDTFDKLGPTADDYCIIRGILVSDMNVIQERLMTILNDRELRKNFLALCQTDPIPVANLFQALLDQDTLPSESRSRLARTLARLAKSSSCYPDCLILTTIRRTGTDPVAGGGFADVWKGYFSEKCVALKALRIYKQSVRESVLKEFTHEAVIWRQLKHPNILPFYGVFTGDKDFDRLCLVSPWMDAGNVIDYLSVHADSNRLSLLLDVAQGLKYLHQFQPPIIHGDLKGANIFVSPLRTACLGDFGLARFRDSQESTLGATTGGTTGTLRWQAPELLNIVEGASAHRSEQCDIYSFGCVCLELMTGKLPFSEIRLDGAVIMAIAKGQIPQRPIENVLERGLDDTLWALMEHCWKFDPALRPTIVQLVEYFQQRHGAERWVAETFEDTYEEVRASLGQYGFPDVWMFW